jgi:hypothetical protein
LLRPVNLSVKLTICLIGGMVAIFSVLGYRIIRLHRENLEEATFAAGDRITDTIKRSTRYSMLHNQSNEIHQIITAIGSQPGIEKIRIFNKAGEVRCSTDEREISARVDKNAEGCYACHVQTGPFSGPGESTPHQLSRAERTRIYDNGGERILSGERAWLLDRRLSCPLAGYEGAGNDQCSYDAGAGRRRYCL